MTGLRPLVTWGSGCSSRTGDVRGNGGRLSASELNRQINVRTHGMEAQMHWTKKECTHSGSGIAAAYHQKAARLPFR
jgi:hypothetical protein